MKRCLLFILLISLLFLSGCWDKVEIDQRIFVSSIGVDANEDGHMNKFNIIYEYPNINAIGKGATEDEKIFILETPASSIFQAARELSTRVPFPFYFKHVKVLVLGHEVLHDEKAFREIIDELNRDTKINKRLQILVAEGKARDIIDVNVIREQTTDRDLYSMVQDDRSSSRYTSQTLAGLISDFDFSGVTITPRVIIKNDRYIVSGGCLLKNYKHLAWIDEKENRAISAINGDIINETIDAIYDDNLISYTVTNIKSRKKVQVDDQIDVHIFVRLEGYLQGYIMGAEKPAYDSQVLKEMEKAIEKSVKREIERTIKKLQKEYNADVIGVGEHISKFQPKKWRELKDKWDELFPDINIQVSVDVKIRRTGLTR